MPSSFSSDTIVLHQVVLGLPLCLFPWGVHLRAILVILDTGILRTCPSHLKRLCCISLRTHVEVPMRFYHSPGLQIYICTLFVETIFKKNWLNALAIGSCVNYVLQWHSSWISSVRVRAMVFNTTFSYIVAVSFIGGGNRSTQRKPQTCRKSLTNFNIMFYRVHLPEWDSNSRR